MATLYRRSDKEKSGWLSGRQTRVFEYRKLTVGVVKGVDVENRETIGKNKATTENKFIFVKYK